MQKSLDLVDSLALERIEVNLFRGTTPGDAPGRIFGGQVIAQSLLAAYETVETRVCHSLHCYFIRPGDPSIPILFEVDRARDGGSFTTRRVVAIQHGQQIFNLAASFQAPEEGFEHQEPMPVGPPPEEIEAEEVTYRRLHEADPEAMQEWTARPRPIEMRGPDFFGEPGVNKPPNSSVWMRARRPIGADPHMHQVVMAYASDLSLLGTAMRPHRVFFRTSGLQFASLDHAIWFHRPTDFNEWHLFVQESPSASGGRGFVRGGIYRRDGVLVASVAQEGLMRLRRAPG